MLKIAPLAPFPGFDPIAVEQQSPRFGCHALPRLTATRPSSRYAGNGFILRPRLRPYSTTHANALLAPIHNQMPVVIEPADWPVWLGAVEGDAAALLRPADEDVLRLWPISPRVNAVRKNDARERRRVPAPSA